MSNAKPAAEFQKPQQAEITVRLQDSDVRATVEIPLENFMINREPFGPEYAMHALRQRLLSALLESAKTSKPTVLGSLNRIIKFGPETASELFRADLEQEILTVAEARESARAARIARLEAELQRLREEGERE